MEISSEDNDHLDLSVYSQDNSAGISEGEGQTIK